MRGKLSAILILAVAALVAGAAGAGPAGLTVETANAGHGKRCGFVTKGNRDFRVFARQMGCKKARRGTRRYLRGNGALPGFTCQRNVPPYRFVCANGAKTYRALRV